MNGKAVFKLFSVAGALSLAMILGMPNVEADTLKVVESEKVCMVTDMHFGKKQIPVEHQGKTYYGCCENCKATLSKDQKARVAIDPVSGKSVDKATAVIVSRDDNSVLYFENQKNFQKYQKSLSGK